MRFLGAILVAAVLGLVPCSFGQTAGKPNQLRNLSEVPQKPRFALTDRDWPGKPGQASVCLWKGDALAACSISIDDNCAGNVPWWLEMNRKYGLRVTWFVITGNVETKVAMGGTWKLWQEVIAAGNDVQSHSVNHLHTESPNWKGPEAEYADSQQHIQQNIPNHKCLTLAYPGGKDQEKINSPELAAKYFIAARGARALINPANQINYMSTNASSAYHLDDVKWANGNFITVFKNEPKNTGYRGWYHYFYHYIKPEPEVQAAAEKAFAFTQEKVKSNELWLGLFREVAQYGQERDTATLSVTESGPGKVVLNLSDQMDDSLFDFPLTVKVRLDPSWTKVSASQSQAQGTEHPRNIPCQIVQRDGVNYALLEVVPDRGPVTLLSVEREPADAAAEIAKKK